MPVTNCYNYAYLDLSMEVKVETQTVCFLFAPLYIGKGQNNRCLHGKIALEEGKPLLTNNLLFKELKRLKKLGHEPEILKFNDGVSSEDALSTEAQIIEQLGRRGIEESGMLCNRARGGAIPDVSGIPKDPESMKLMVKTRRANGSYTTGEKHPRARKFLLISPEGTVHEVVGELKQFCTTHNLSWQTLYGNQNVGPIKLDRSKYKNTKRLSERFWNTLGWECQTPNPG